MSCCWLITSSSPQAMTLLLCPELLTCKATMGRQSLMFALLHVRVQGMWGGRSARHHGHETPTPQVPSVQRPREAFAHPPRPLRGVGQLLRAVPAGGGAAGALGAGLGESWKFEPVRAGFPPSSNSMALNETASVHATLANCRCMLPSPITSICLRVCTNTTCCRQQLHGNPSVCACPPCVQWVHVV
jgi:hypothetical protein